MRKSFVIFLSILFFLSALLLGSVILSKNISAVPPPNPPGLSGATEMHWAYINTGVGPPVRNASHPSITVWEHSLGHYYVTFPSGFEVKACTATISSSWGGILATPGELYGGLSNEVRVLTWDPGLNQIQMDFTVVAYSKRGTN